MVYRLFGMLPPKILIILLVVFVGLGFMMYKRFKNRLKKQRAKVADLTQMLQSRSQPEEEEEEEEKKEIVPSNDDFSNMDTKEGHPIVKEPTKAHYPHGNTWWSVRKGRAKTAEKCWKHARRNNIRGWGWRKHDKSCWHYLDPLLMSADTHPGSEANHLMGCNEPGQKVDDGCMDFDHGHTIWGYNSTSTADFKKKRGLKAHQIWGKNWGHDKMSPDECRRKAKALGYKATGYRTSFHPNNGWKNTCWTYGKKNSTKGLTSNAGDLAHITMCTDQTKRVIDGC